MKTTMDNAGRLVIPRNIRRESRIKPGIPLDVRWEKGAITITPAPLLVKLERKGRLLVAVPTKDTPRLYDRIRSNEHEPSLLYSPKNNVADDDAVIGACAEQGKASTVLTFNVGDFTALGQDFDVVVPGTI